MGGLSHGAKWWWEYFKQVLFDVHTSVEGSITLGYGMQSLNVNIDPSINPLDIFVNCTDNSTPVCVGNISMATARLNDDNTFTLTVNVQSNSCTVKWLIEYQPFFTT